MSDEKKRVFKQTSELSPAHNGFTPVIPQLKGFLLEALHGIVVDYLQDELGVVSTLLGSSEKAESYYRNELMKIEKNLKEIDAQESSDLVIKQKLKKLLKDGGSPIVLVREKLKELSERDLDIKEKSIDLDEFALRDMLGLVYLKKSCSLVMTRRQENRENIENLGEIFHLVNECQSAISESHYLEAWVKLVKMGEEFRKSLYKALRKENNSYYLFAVGKINAPFLQFLRAIEIEKIKEIEKNPNQFLIDLIGKGGMGEITYEEIWLVKCALNINGADVNYYGNPITRWLGGFTSVKSAGTPLTLASWSKSPELIAVLLAEADIDVNKVDARGNSALITASTYGSISTVAALLRHPNINILQRNREGFTALHCASSCASVERVKLLLCESKYGKKEIEEVIKLAKKRHRETRYENKGFDEIIKLLEEYKKQKPLLMKFGQYRSDFFSHDKKISGKQEKNTHYDFISLTKLSKQSLSESDENGVKNIIVKLPKDLDENEKNELLKDFQQLLTISYDYFGSKTARSVQLKQETEVASGITQLIITGLEIDKLAYLMEYLTPHNTRSKLAG